MIKNKLKSLIRNILLMFLVLISIVFTHQVAHSDGEPNEISVWAASALENVSRDVGKQQRVNFANINKNKQIQLYAARGEYESFQIVVQGDKSIPLNDVNVTTSDLIKADGAAVAKQNITLYREHYVYVDKPSPPDSIGNPTKGKGWYPDGLIPFVDSSGNDIKEAALDAVPFDVYQGRNQPIWVDIYVPRDTPPGKYQGTYTVTSNLGKSTGKINLLVWDFELPLEPRIKSLFNPWQDRGENMAEEMLKHRAMPSPRIKPKEHAELINKWGLNNIRLPFWSGANYQTCKLSPAPSVAEIKQASALYSDQVLKFVKSADEVDKCSDVIEPIKQWANNIHQAGVKHLVVMKPIPELYDYVDIWVVQPKMYQESKAEIAEVMKQGDEVWLYAGKQADYSPQWQIDTSPINFRIPQGFIAQSLGLTGVLYPQIDGWSDNTDNLPLYSNDPWYVPSVYQQNDKNFPGEGMLLYPGEEVGVEGVVPSLRLKRIRDGIEDYEYIEILKNLGHKNWAMKIVRQVGKDWHNWTKNPQSLDFARYKLGEKINQISS